MILGPPRRQRVSQRADLVHLVAAAAGDRLVDQDGGFVRVVGQVDVAHRLLSQPGAQHLVVGVADAQTEQHPVVAPVVEALGAGEQLADPIQRVGLAAPVAEGLVLDPPAHLVHAAVPDPHHMKGVGHPGGMRQVRVEPAR